MLPMLVPSSEVVMVPGTVELLVLVLLRGHLVGTLACGGGGDIDTQDIDTQDCKSYGIEGVGLSRVATLDGPLSLCTPPFVLPLAC